MTETTQELDAALAEGLAPLPQQLIPLRDEYLSLKEQKDMLTARQDEIKETFAEALKTNGLQGFILHGKVHVRRSDVTDTRVDSKKLKEKLPHVYAQFIKVTRSVRMTIN